MTFQRDLPATPEDLRRRLYQGQIFLLPPTERSLSLVDLVDSLISKAFQDLDDRRQAHQLENHEFFVRVGGLRQEIFCSPRVLHATAKLIEELGFQAEDIAVDPPKLRAVAHEGHENPAAAPVYYAHRDTWYANSQAMLNWWLPLDDLAEEETFCFYPDYFQKPVPNDSETFDYDRWTSAGQGLRVGWQDAEASKKAAYPGVTEEVNVGHEMGFSCRRGELLLFSGAHFHGTRKQSTGKTRFSIDFRTVDLADHGADRGAPNVDNRSTGLALIDFERLHDRTA